MTQAYKVIEADSIHELVLEVNQYLEEQWKIVGGVAITTNAQGSVPTFYQTIFKDRK